MQKSMFLNKKMDKAQHLLKLRTGVIKGALPAWKNIKHSNFLYWLIFYAFLKIALEIFWKIHQCASKTC